MDNEMEAPQLEQKKLTDWANEPTLADLKADLEAAQPNHDAFVLYVSVVIQHHRHL